MSSKRSDGAETVSAHEKLVLLKLVHEKHGELTPDLVVQEANPQNAEGVAHRLAGLVGWNTDDVTAASRWRIDQARLVIRSVEPELIHLGVLKIEAPHYVRDPRLAPGQAGYTSIMSIKTDREVAADVLDAETRRAVGSLERALSIALALEMEEEASGLIAALAALGRAPAATIPGGEGASVPQEV